MVRDAPLDPPSEAAAADAAAAVLDREVADATAIAEGLNAVYRVDLADGTRLALKVATVVEDEDARPEPRVLDRIARETDVPVPEVVAAVDPENSPLGAAFYLAEFFDGRNVPDARTLDPGVHERVVAESGHHLAGIHSVDVPSRVGRLRVVDGDLRVPDPDPGWDAAFRNVAWGRVAKLRGEGPLADADARFADLADRAASALAEFPEAVDDAVEPVLLHGDYRPSNLVLSPPGERPSIRAVIDVGGDVGDGLFDLAVAEAGLVDVPVTDPNRQAELRETLRASYREHGHADDAFETRYPYYRLYALVKCLGAFDFFAQFAPGDEDKIAARWRAAFDERLAALPHTTEGGGE